MSVPSMCDQPYQWFVHFRGLFKEPALVVLIQLLCRVRLFATPWTAACQTSLSIINSRSLLKFMSIVSVTPSNCLILSCPLLLLPSVFPSIRVFSYKSALHIRWPKYWSFSFSICPSKEYSGLVSFGLTGCISLQSLLQHYSSKASILRHCFLYRPTLTSKHNYWKNHSFD